MKKRNKIVLSLIAAATIAGTAAAVLPKTEARAAEPGGGKTVVITSCDTADGFYSGVYADKTSYVEGGGSVMCVNQNIGIFYTMYGLDTSELPAWHDAWFEAFIYIDKPDQVTEAQFELTSSGRSDMSENSLSQAAMALTPGWNFISFKMDNENLEWAVNVGGEFVYEELKAMRLYFLAKSVVKVRLDNVVITDTPHTYTKAEVEAMEQNVPHGQTEWTTSTDVAGAGKEYADIEAYVESGKGCKGALGAESLYLPALCLTAGGIALAVRKKVCKKRSDKKQ